MTNTLGGTTEYYYDHQGLVVAEKDPRSSFSYYTHDRDMQIIGVTDAFGQSYSLSYDGSGNLVGADDPVGNSMLFEYSGPFNRLSRATDANGNGTCFESDSEGNLTSVVYADRTSHEFTYDSSGNRTLVTNRRSDPVAYEYDDFGRMISKTYSDATSEQYEYDPVTGNLVSITDAAGTTTLEYTSPHGDYLPTKITYPSGRFLQYTYDSSARRTRMIDQDGSEVNYSYDAFDRLTSLKGEGGTLIAGYTYDSAGKLSRRDLANGTWTTYEYDLLGRLIRMVNYAADGSSNSFFEYAYDEILLRTSMNTNDGLWTYQFDAVGQLTSAVFASNNPALIPDQDLAYEYDAVGNRVRTIENGVTADYESNELNQVETMGSVTCVYDADGNLIRKIDGDSTTTYTYDPDNRLVAFESPLDKWVYDYDAFGNRIATTHNGDRVEYLIDPLGLGNVVAEYDDNGMVSHYTHGLGGLTSRVDADGSEFFYDTDEMGTVVGLSNAAGFYENSYVFDPFGEVLSQSGSLDNQFLFDGAHGVMADGSGLYYMRNRFYDAESGRFLSVDPLRFPGHNSYAYVSNNPLQYIDPLGLEKVVELEGAFLRPGDAANLDAILKNSQGYQVSSSGTPTSCSASTGPSQRPVFIQPGALVANEILDTGPGGSGGGGGGSGGGSGLGAQAGGAGGGGGNQPPGPGSSNSPKLCKSGCGGGNGGSSGTVAAFDPNQKIGPLRIWRRGICRGGYPILLSRRLRKTTPRPPPRLNELTSPTNSARTSTGRPCSSPRSASVTRSSRFLPEVSTSAPRSICTTTPGTSRSTSNWRFSPKPAKSTPPSSRSIQTRVCRPDVLTGFLPPEDGTGRGMGYFSYVIDPAANLPTGTEIRNVAPDYVRSGRNDRHQPDRPSRPQPGHRPRKGMLQHDRRGGPPQAPFSRFPQPATRVSWLSGTVPTTPVVRASPATTSTHPRTAVRSRCGLRIPTKQKPISPVRSVINTPSTVSPPTGSATSKRLRLSPTRRRSSTASGPVTVEDVFVSTESMTEIEVVFASEMNIAPMLAPGDGSIVAAVSITNFENGLVQLTTDEFSYDDTTRTLTLTLSNPLSAGYYDLRLDGSMLMDMEGLPLRGVGGGLTFSVGELDQEQILQAGDVDLQVDSYSVPSLADWNGGRPRGSVGW